MWLGRICKIIRDWNFIVHGVWFVIRNMPQSPLLNSHSFPPSVKHSAISASKTKFFIFKNTSGRSPLSFLLWKITFLCIYIHFDGTFLQKGSTGEIFQCIFSILWQLDDTSILLFLLMINNIEIYENVGMMFRQH